MYFKKAKIEVPAVAQQKQIRVASMRMWVWSLASLSGSGIWHCRELWCRLHTWLGAHVPVAVVWPAALAWIRPLAREPPSAAGVALEEKKKKITLFPEKKKQKLNMKKKQILKYIMEVLFQIRERWCSSRFIGFNVTQKWKKNSKPQTTPHSDDSIEH